jgi:hypothetical protein
VVQRSARVVMPGLLLALLLAGGIASRPVARGTATESSDPITSLAVDPTDGSLLMARRGLFRSADTGQNWTDVALPSSLHPDKLVQIATTPAAPDSIFAAGPGAGVLRSDDNGQRWNLVSDGLPSQEVAAFAVQTPFTRGSRKRASTALKMAAESGRRWTRVRRRAW